VVEMISVWLVMEMMIFHFLMDIRLHLDNAVKDLALTLSPNITNGSRRASSPSSIMPLPVVSFSGIGSISFLEARP
jgi:hypothetical protein